MTLPDGRTGEGEQLLRGEWGQAGRRGGRVAIKGSTGRDPLRTDGFTSSLGGRHSCAWDRAAQNAGCTQGVQESGETHQGLAVATHPVLEGVMAES